MKYTSMVFSLLFLATIVQGQGLFEMADQAVNNGETNSFNLHGYVRGSAFGAAEKYDLSNSFGELSIQADLKQDNMLMHADVRFRSGYQFNQPLSEFEVKEAYAGISTNFIDIILGEKIESWGRTDGFNPTNNITPNNYFFFSANPDDQKLPNLMLKTDLRITPQINWEVITLPVFRPSVYRYDLFDMGSNATFVEAVKPDVSFENASLATKLNFEFTGIGFSASWFHGYDPFYGFELQNIDFSTGNPRITYIPTYYQKSTIGFDVALPLETWIFRSEGAYNITDNELETMYIPKSDLSYVVGLEHDFNGFLTIIQYIGKSTFDFSELTTPVLTDQANPLAQMQYANDLIVFESTQFNRKTFHQQEERNHALSLTVSKDFAYQTLNVEFTGYYNITSEEYIIRPNISWKIGGSLTASAGYSMMQGPEKSIFNYAGPIMNGAWLQLKVDF